MTAKALLQEIERLSELMGGEEQNPREDWEELDACLLNVYTMAKALAAEENQNGHKPAKDTLNGG